LLMPDPIRPLALLASEDTGNGEESLMPAVDEEENSNADLPEGESTTDMGSPLEACAQKAGTDSAPPSSTDPVAHIGVALTQDPYGRDAPRRSLVKAAWSPESLAKYLKGVASQIDSNIQNERLPTAEKLDAFIKRLVSNTHRQLRHAPKKARRSMNELCARVFYRFWNFSRNEKVGNTSPEELTSVLLCIVEALLSEAVPGFYSKQSSLWQQHCITDLCN
jgi:hypothetical protein